MSTTRPPSPRTTPDLGAIFESERPRLFALAYRMVGIVGDAEDVVQDAFLRLRGSTTAVVDSPPALLTTIVVRLCLDVLKSKRSQREQYDGLWLPEFLATHEQTIDRDSLAVAFMMLLETLSPDERAIYLLHEVFDYSHAEVGSMLDKTEEACRQLLRRARQRVGSREPRYVPSAAQSERLIATFIKTCATGDVDGMRRLLTEDARAWADGGGKVTTARRAIDGADRVARYLIGIANRNREQHFSVHTVELNGAPGLLLRKGETLQTALLLGCTTELRIAYVALLRNPDKLRRLA
ncbi:MAG TPA: RNA polymerase sigma factor SigJ [Polyangiaceae bacterium]|nr:RNA polymerase sigma factor SigJ [Polyangiaceae bacterium]